MVGARAPQRPVAASATLAPRQGPVHHGQVGGPRGRNGSAVRESCQGCSKAEPECRFYT